MKLTNQDVLYTAGLAKLKFDEATTASLAEDLSGILEYAEKINELDTEDVAPLTHVLENANMMREDEVGATLSIEETLQNAPDRTERAFRVPKML
jgi:aspartyl-tRNA(Asn)/glutamyl-tRNA(Gln) amidotransferase subunit C